MATDDDTIAWRNNTTTVYALVDMRNGSAFYVGIARSPFRRWQGHLAGMDRESPKARMLHHVNYADDAAGMAILASCGDMSEARRLERYLITKHAPTLTNTQHGVVIHTRDTDGARFMHAPPPQYGDPGIALDATLSDVLPPAWYAIREDIAWAHDCEEWTKWKRDCLCLSSANVVTVHGKMLRVSWKHDLDARQTTIEAKDGRWSKWTRYTWEPRGT